MSENVDTSSIQPQPDAPAEPRVSKMSGRAYDPVIKKKELPVVRVEILPAPEFAEDTRPVAKRSGPEKTRTGAVQTTTDPDLVVLERAVKRDDTAERDAVAKVKAKLRRTLLGQAQAAADAAAAFDREHGDYFRRLRAVLTSGELLRQAGNGSRDRLNRLDGVVRRAIRTMDLLPAHPAKVAQAIDEIAASTLVPAMTSKGQGYDADMMRSPGITKVERLAATSNAEGVTKSLNEALETANAIVAELAARIGEQKLKSTLEEPVSFITSPDTQEMREASRPRPPQTRAHGDFNPLDHDNDATDWSPYGR